jgi:hypothetical protein
MALMLEVRRLVAERLGVDLRAEVRLVGFSDTVAGALHDGVVP